MSDKTDDTMDLEAERAKAAKALNLSYADLKNANFWQRDVQTNEARRELEARLRQEAARTQAAQAHAAPLDQSRARTCASGAQAPSGDSGRVTESDRVLDAGEIFSRGRPASADSQAASVDIPAREDAHVPVGTQVRALMLKLSTFLKNRAERKRAVGVEAQKEEKSRQMGTALVGVAALLLLAGLAVWLSGGAHQRETAPVRVYKSDFRLEPEALDKQSYQNQYDEKLERVTARLQTMEELAQRLERELKAAGQKRTAADDASPRNAAARPVSDLPDFTASGPAGQQAERLNKASRAAPPPAPAPEGVRLARLAVSDPVADRKAIITEARERYTPPRPTAADTLIAGNRAKHEAAGTYLPAGSFARAVVLAGATVSTGGTSASNPVPMLFELTDLARLPNAFRSNVKACFVTADATGDLSSERVWIRLQRLSCMTRAGKAFDARIQGYATGDDGKTGVRARLVTRSGQAIASALLTGSISGLGKAVSLSAQNTTTYTSGAVGTTVTDSFKAGLGEGMESALDRIADYYIRLADKIFPCLEIDSGRKVDLILSQGLTIGPEQGLAQAAESGAGRAAPLAINPSDAVFAAPVRP